MDPQSPPPLPPPAAEFSLFLLVSSYINNMTRVTTVCNRTGDMLKLEAQYQRSVGEQYYDTRVVQSGNDLRIPSSKFKDDSDSAMLAVEIFLFVNNCKYIYTLCPYAFIKYSKLTFTLQGDSLVVKGELAPGFMAFSKGNTGKEILVLQTAQDLSYQYDPTVANDGSTVTGFMNGFMNYLGFIFQNALASFNGGFRGGAGPVVASPELNV